MDNEEPVIRELKDGTVTVEFDCGHEFVYGEPVPQPGDVIYCVRCDRGTVVRSGVTDLRVRCRPCRFSRPVPSNEMFEARMMANNHYGSSKHRARAKDGYPPLVLITDGKRTVQTVGASPPASPVPF